MLDRLLADALAGWSRVAVLRGEAGVGKSALLSYLSGRVACWHVARAAGVESEMELAYAGLHQLCAPMLDHLDRLPAPQRDALATVFGRTAGAAPDRFLVGLATLTLFAEVAEQQPLVCIVDDAQWLDHASAQILGFVARRLLAERVAVVCAARTGAGDDVLAGLPVLGIRSAGRAQARGGIAAAAAFLQRSAELTVDPARRAGRALAAARASFQAGAFEAALGLVATAEAGPQDEFQPAWVDLVRGQLAFASGLASDAPPLLLKAARRLELIDLDLARETSLTAWGAASVAAGQAAGRGVLLEICRAVRALPPRPGAPRPLDLLLGGLALLTTNGHAAATPVLQRAATALADIPVEDVVRWGWMATAASNAVWDNDGAHAISARQVQLIRDAGALAELPLYLSALGLASAWMGDFAGAASNIVEADSVAAATGSHFAPYTLLRLRALQGREAEASAAIEQAAAGGPSAGLYAQWAAAVLYNGLARYQEAAWSARRATSNTFEYWVSVWALPELVEAAMHAGDMELARDALARLAETTQPAGTDFALGIETRSRALLSDGTAANDLYREAIERFSRTRLRPELARAYLLYGEWLRREGRRVDAREQLRTAHHLFDAIGMEAFAERARRELLATGEKARKRSAGTREGLTPQEEQIARLAREGLSNPEIGAQLFVSARTIEWHLRNVFTKLGITSRRQLRTALSEDGRFVGTPT
jgi:DNA-binding CsgD family transcriptional regulator